MRLVETLEARLQDMGVDLRRGKRCVPQHHLDRPEVGAAIEQVRRERMPQRVRRYILKAAWVTFGTTAAAELAGQLTIGKGFTSQFRPRQYFTIQKASLERLTDDIEQFVNFFVIESQRILFAENVYTTIAVSFQIASRSL